MTLLGHSHDSTVSHNYLVYMAYIGDEFEVSAIESVVV